MQALDSTLVINTKLLFGVLITPSNNFVFISTILLALYPCQVIILMQYSMRLLACAGAAETMPSHGPHRKSFNLLQFSP